MMPMRVQSASHSSMECDVSSTVWPVTHSARVARLLRLVLAGRLVVLSPCLYVSLPICQTVAETSTTASRSQHLTAAPCSFPSGHLRQSAMDMGLVDRPPAAMTCRWRMPHRKWRAPGSMPADEKCHTVKVRAAAVQLSTDCRQEARGNAVVS